MSDVRLDRGRHNQIVCTIPCRGCGSERTITEMDAHGARSYSDLPPCPQCRRIGMAYGTVQVVTMVHLVQGRML